MEKREKRNKKFIKMGKILKIYFKLYVYRSSIYF